MNILLQGFGAILNTEHYRTKEIEIDEETTVADILNEYELSPISILISINNEVLLPSEVMRRTLVKGDRLLIIPLVEGG